MSPSSKSSNVAPHDDRPFISDLLKEYSSEIESVRNIIQDDNLYNKGDNSTRYDDIWILRFLLSHKKNVEKAAKAAIKTMHYREEMKLNELGDIRHRTGSITGPTSIQFPMVVKYQSFCKNPSDIINTLPNKDRGIVTYLNIGGVNTKKLAKEMSVEDIQEAYMYSNECTFQVLDEVTRRTGKLTKWLKILDCDGLYFTDLSMKYVQKDGAANKASDCFYPQLLGAMLIVNSPSWAQNIWKVIRPFFPVRVVEKINFFGSDINPEDKKHFLRYISEESLPEKYGGNNKEWPNVEDVAKTYRKADDCI
mmetsp:Transcript_10030/g.11130  ORF Transcript_10030/g.11130 Transcript_10030/m.11130 type:complete len:307 (-) Transcript_10030:217-1137(-)